MTYTDKKPTAPGWYWCRLDEADKWIVIYFDGSKATKCGGTVEIDIENFPDGQFAGPIPEPSIHPVDALKSLCHGMEFDAEIEKQVRTICDYPVVVYQCRKCGHQCTEDEMEADAMTGTDPEVWSNWICPKCKTWHKSLEEGWKKQ